MVHVSMTRQQLVNQLATWRTAVNAGTIDLLAFEAIPEAGQTPGQRFMVRAKWTTTATGALSIIGEPDTPAG